MCVKVLIILLLFGVQLYSGQDVAKIELDNGKEVYEIREIKNKSVELINPKKDMPILREIIFYKVIEKPYIQETYDEPIIEKSKDEQEKREPEFDETRRAFTNGHGLQFLDWGNQNENAYNIENRTDLSENKSNNNDGNLAESGENSDIGDTDDKDDIVQDKNDSDLNDDNYNNDNDNDKNNNTTFDKNDDMSEYNDDTEDSNKKQLDIENENIQNHDNYTGDGQNRNNTSANEGINVKDGDENSKTNVTKQHVNEENSKEAKIQEEEINLAKKLREQLLNSTKEKYHSVQRVHKPEHQDRRKREVNYRNIPEAPRLPDLDVKSFPSYIQRMLASRPIVGNDEKLKIKNDYDTKLFDKMSGIFPSDTASGEAKAYGFKYNKGQSTSWNGIHKNQNDHLSDDLDLSGSQTNNPYEVQKPTIDIRDNVPEEDEMLSKNKEKSYDSPKNIVPSLDIPVEKDHFIIKKNTERENQRNKDFDNKENVNTNYIDNGFDIKNRLVDMLQNIDSKLSNGQRPKTYGMSLRGDKGEIWNDIVGAPLTNIDNTHHEDVSENDTKNNPNNLNNFENEKQDNVEDKDYDERNPIEENNIPESDNGANIFNINDSREGGNSFNNDNKKELDNYDKGNTDEERATEETTEHEVNNAEKTPFDLNLFNMPSPTPKLPDFKFNEQFITSTNKPEISYEQVSEHQTTGIPNFPYFSQRSTEKTNFVEPEVEKKHQPIDNESLRRKMEESFNNIIKQFPKLEPMKEETTGGEDLRKDEDNKKPRTYGMHLKDDHGYVWNDLTNPGTHINVGDSENIEVTEPSVDEVTPNSSIEETNSTETHSESPIETTTMNEKKSDTTTNKYDEEATEESITTTIEKESVTEGENNVTTDKTIDNELEYKEDCTCKNDTLTKDKVESGNNKNTTESIKLTLDDLLKKDEFWQWLSNWTTTYMDVLNERMEKLVEDKVTKRLENNDKNTNDENKNNDEVDPDKKNNKNNETNKIDKETGNNDDDDSSKTPNIDHLKTNNNSSNINNDGKEKSNSTEIKSEKDVNNVNKTGTTTEKSDTKPISKDNSTKEDRSKKKNDTLPFNIKADTIYGNAIDSDHVTNIFIFYPNAKLNETIDQSGPLINKTNLAKEKPANVTFDERIAIPENDKDNQINKPETSTEISSSTQSNTETNIAVSTTSERPTTTEGLTKNTSKDKEESKNENKPKPSKITDSDLKGSGKATEKLDDENHKTETPKTDQNETTTETTKTENKNKETTKLSDKEATTESIKTESEKATTILSDNEVTTELPKPENNKNTTINEKETTTDSSKKENGTEITKHDEKETTTELIKTNTTKETTTDSNKKENGTEITKHDQKETTTELIKTENGETTKVEDNKTTTPTSDANVTTTDKPEITTESSSDKPSDLNTTESATDSKDTSDVTTTEKSAAS